MQKAIGYIRVSTQGQADEGVSLEAQRSKIAAWCSLNDAEFRTDPNFGFEVPVAVNGVDSQILDPRAMWADKDGYDATAATLVKAFVDNFAQFEEHVDDGVRSAALTAA